MSITHTKTYSVTSTAGGSPLSGSFADVAATEITMDTTFAASTSNQLVTMGLTVANLQSLFLICDKGCTITTNGTAAADVQTISITGTPTGGTFPITFGGQVTEVAYSASNTTMQTALQALSTIGSGNVTCTGGPLPGTAIVCTFAGTLATGQQSLMTTFSGQLTGGSTPTAIVTHTTPGLPTNTIALQPGTPLSWSRSETYYACPFTSNVTAWYVTTTVAARLQGKMITN
jgi:hypothetical protein